MVQPALPIVLRQVANKSLYLYLYSMCSQTEYSAKSTCTHITHREYACTTHRTRMKYACIMHSTRMEYTSDMHGICLYHAWYTHKDPGKMHACFRPVPCLPSTCKRPNSLHVLVLSHETCMAHAHYALQDHAISIHELMRDLAHGMC